MDASSNSTGALSASSIARAMNAVVAALDRGRGTEAVRQFGDALDHGIAAPETDLARWLVKTIGKQNASRLIRAYADHPCFYCKNGLEVCEACDGHGHFNDNTVCGTCVTTGVARCDFCDGSGLVTYNAMPASLRLSAAIDRVKLASKAMAAVLDRPAPRSSRAQPRECLKTCAKRLTEVNRLMGIFENALVLARSVGEASPQSRPVVAKILQRCLKHATRCRGRIHDILECMAECARNMAQDSGLPSAARDIAKKRLSFLSSMLEPSSTLAGTALHHPFLCERSEEFVRAAMGKREPQCGSTRAGVARSLKPEVED